MLTQANEKTTMSSSRFFSFLFLFLFLSLSLLCVQPSAFLISPRNEAVDGLSGDQKPTAYEVLQSYDFPVGILPRGAVGYDLDASTGAFSARFNGTCSFSLEGSYQLRYQSTISGRIARDRLDRLHGVSVKILFFWLNIVEVVRIGDHLQFSVGVASADFPLDNFYECPGCGCGMNCPNEGHGDGNALDAAAR